MDNTTKPFYLSKTIWGLILVAIGGALQGLQGVPSEVGKVIGLIGLILAAVGRTLADQPLSLN